MKVTLSNGVTVDGEPEDVRKMIEGIGLNPLGTTTEYYSGSKGTLKIATMNTMHLRNAILKHYEDWVNGLHTIADPKEFIQALTNGPQNPTWLAMVTEMAKRDK